MLNAPRHPSRGSWRPAPRAECVRNVSGTIDGPGYANAKAQVCVAAPGADLIIEAIEWELVHSDDESRYHFVEEVDGVPFFAVTAPATAISPGITVVFTFEDWEGANKIVLVDVWLSADAPADDDDDDG